MTVKIFLLLLALGAGGVRAQELPPPVEEPQAPEEAQYDINGWPSPDRQPNPRDVPETDLAALKDRLSSSLLYRGELADKIIDAGLAAGLVNLEGAETYSDVRLALLEWIKKNLDKAADLALHFKGGGVAAVKSVTYYEKRWELNPGFLEKIKALSAAAGDLRVSSEALELAAHRLYGGSAEGSDGPAVAGGGRGGGTGFFSGGYADYKLNRAGLGRELSGAGNLLDSMRGSAGKGPAGAERAYASAVARYGAFLVASAALKGRNVITGAESGALESGRAGLRSALAALTLRARSSEAGDIAARLSAGGESRPGPLVRSAEALRRGLEKNAERVESGLVPVKELGRLVSAAERNFSEFYLKYSVYSGLYAVGGKVRELGFSCVYDYLLWRWLAWFGPEAAGVKARAALKSAAAGIGGALVKASEGDLSGALSGEGGNIGEISSVLALAGSFSAFNRAAQFFSWGILFRPVELEVTVKNGRPAFRPAFTFYRVAAPLRRNIREPAVSVPVYK